MLHRIELEGVGPASKMTMDLAPRLNVITGDNGLGKTFLLDVAWFVLTRTWPRYPATPRAPGVGAKIRFAVDAQRDQKTYETSFVPRKQTWSRSVGRPPSPGLVMYARVDGSFAVWDPARNYWRDAPSLGVDDPQRPEAFLLSPAEVWDGLRQEVAGRTIPLCRGLIEDWVTWQAAEPTFFEALKVVLEMLSPDPAHPIRPAKPVRMNVDDARDYPAVTMPYGVVSLVHASAGVQRIAALAYLLIWSVSEHMLARERLGLKETHQVTLLVDEVEAHLHPQWQRRVLPSLLDVAVSLQDAFVNANLSDLQFIVSTHAPLVLTSLEPHFDEARDRLWTLDLRGSEVELSHVRWEKRGDVANWLSSDVFDHTALRPIEAEEALDKAKALAVRDSVPARELARVERALRAHIPELDPFWKTWGVLRQKWANGPHGVKPR
jgi:hypothetical protein